MEKTVFISMPIEDLQTVIIDCVNSCLKHHPKVESHKSDSHEGDLMTVPELAAKLKSSLPYIYFLTSKNLVPFMKKGKKIYFSRIEIDAWIKTGKRKTVDELAVEASDYLANKKGSK